MKVPEEMSGLVCMVQASWLEDLEGVPDTEQDMVLGNLIRAFFTGESQADRFDGLLWNLYRRMEREVLKMRAAALAGRKGGMKRASKYPSKYPSKDTGKELLIINNEEITAIANSGSEALKSLLRSWNEITESNLRSWPKRAREGILNALESGRTLVELENCIRLAMTWEPRYRTPTGVFADGRVEQWLNRPQENQPKDWPKEKPCPSCGGKSALQTPGIYRCPACGAIFKGAV